MDKVIKRLDVAVKLIQKVGEASHQKLLDESVYCIDNECGFCLSCAARKIELLAYRTCVETIMGKEDK